MFPPVHNAQGNPEGMVKTCPRLTPELVAKHLPDSSVIDKGHLIWVRQGVGSTRSMRQTIVDARESVDGMDPNEQICHITDNVTMFCYAVLANNNKTYNLQQPTMPFFSAII